MSEAGTALDALLALMARLRDPAQGCPWDRVQSFASIAPYTIEEAYEVADAIEGGDPRRLEDELGDLLFQVVFHARMAQEHGWFDFAAVARGITAKLVSRHPHVFAPQAGQDTPTAQGELASQWEAHKERERAGEAERRGRERSSLLADVPLALPALVRAGKLGKRAGRVGFDWPDEAGVRAKVQEELTELDRALASAGAEREAITEELGDLLFALAQLGRHLGADAENALRAANGKFERRFALMEARAREQGRALDSLSFDEWEVLWQASKRASAAP